jgi:hypothetical protein
VDFASAYLDSEPPYANDPNVMEPWEEEKIEQFGDRWPTVRNVMYAFQAYGIYLSDIKPGNIEFAD